MQGETESSIKSHPLPTPSPLPTEPRRVTYIRLTKGSDLICDLRDGEKRMKKKKTEKKRDACNAVCVYACMYACGVKDENPLSRLTYHGLIFCNIDEPSRFKLDVFVRGQHNGTWDIGIHEHFGNTKYVCLDVLSSPSVSV